MSRYSDPNTRFDRINAVVWVAAVHLAVAALMTLGTRSKIALPVPPPTTQLIEITPDDPPPPPPPPPPPQAEAARAAEGAAGKRAVATPVVAPEPPVRVETANPLPATRVAGAGAASSAGAARAGRGSGAGGTGNGSGGGDGVAIGRNAQLLSGGLNRRDYRMLRSFSAPDGQAVVALLVGPHGRVEQCRTRQSSGDERLDRALCAILAARMMWSPARDEAGRPLAVGIDYTAVWARD